MSKVLSAARWSLSLLAKRISSLRNQSFYSPSTIYGTSAYDESQMKENDELKRQQKAMIEYDC
ncbi:hypothetical protein [Synechococcus sp. MIT S1220]|uniref:hypothetical protein n=1 Tax=Synechococcus sp. MIT S1220 TaxID=3082549 RepID=UPI0039B0C2E2